MKRAAKKKASKKLQKKAQEDGENGNGGLTEAEADKVEDLVDQILEEVQDLVEDAGETPAEGGALGELESDVEETAENVQDLVEDIKALTAAKRNLESQLQKANLEKAQFNARISRLEQDVEERDRQAKLNTITNIVSGSAMYQGLPAEEIQKQIDTYMNTGWSVDQIQQHIEPLEANFRRASSGGGATGYKTASAAQTAQPTTRLPLGKVETRSASVQNTATENTAGNELPSFMRLATETFGRRYNSHSSSTAGGVQ